MITHPPKLAITVLLFLNLTLVSSQINFVNFGNIEMHASSNLSIFGDVENYGNFSSNTGDVYLSGSTVQNISGTTPMKVGNLILNNDLKLDLELQIKNTLSFNSSIITTDRTDNASEFVHFLAGASYSGESATSYVDGVVRKTGNTSFEFPIGENGLYRYVGISAPSNLSDHFTSYYANLDPNIAGFDHDLKDPSIEHISNCEHWVIDRTNGSSNVTVKLSYDNSGTAGCSGVTNQADLIIARWDGSTWKDHGNSTTTGTPSSGNITTFGSVTSFSPFTLGSTTTNNPLPVELISFNANKMDKKVLISWETASEINSSHFIIQKSNDLLNWEDIADVDAKGNSTTNVAYKDFDHSPYSGVSYYRLKQFDLDGRYSFSKSEAVEYKQNKLESFTVYPNPTTGIVTIKFSETSTNLTLTNALGNIINIQSYILSTNDESIVLNLERLPKGLYFISNNKNQMSKLIIQ